jgi:hypothetical protein
MNTYIVDEKNSRSLPLVLFRQGSETAAMWLEGRSGKTSGDPDEGDNCHSHSTFTPHKLHTEKATFGNSSRVFLYLQKEKKAYVTLSL